MYVVKVGKYYLIDSDDPTRVVFSASQRDALRYESNADDRIADLLPGARFVKLRPKA